MAKTVLITGINGFVGHHLTKLLAEKGFEIVGVDMEIENSGKDLKEFSPDIELINADLRDEHKVDEIFNKYEFYSVYHLAAQSSVKLSFENPAETFSINVNGSLNLLETISRLESPPKILLISSSEIYGQLRPDQVPVGEDFPMKPVNPYAVSKATVDMLAYQYWKAYGLPIYWARAFSHSGPGQKTVAVLSDWAFQTAKIELGLRPPELAVGNMEVTRDYADVRDVIQAYYMILEKGKAGEPYNVSSGNGYRLDDLLGIITSLSSKKIEVVSDPSRFRPVDIPILIGAPDKIKADTGWQPKINIEQTLKDLYEYWIAYLTPQIEQD